jgi:hypothetical protein
MHYIFECEQKFSIYKYEPLIKVFLIWKFNQTRSMAHIKVLKYDYSNVESCSHEKDYSKKMA